MDVNQLGTTVSYETRPVKAMVCRVMEVNRVKFTCTLQGERNDIFEDVALMMTRSSGGNGEGGYWIPKVDDMVWVLLPSRQRQPIIIGGAPIPEEGPEDPDDEESPAADYRMNRPVLNEGDFMINSQDGNFMISRRGGGIEMGSTQGCQMIMLPIGNLIRYFAENFYLNHTGGELSWTTRRAEEGEDERSPVEYRLQVKEYAQDDPLIDIGLGRIQDEGGQRLMGGAADQIVARILINNRFRLWVDKDGNLQQYNTGVRSETSEGMRIEYCDAKWYREVRGLFRSQAAAHYIHSSRDTELTAGRDLRISVNGKKVEQIAGEHQLATKGAEYLHEGPVNEQITGNRETLVTGNSNEGAGGDKKISAGGDIELSAGGSLSIKAVNASVNGTAIDMLATAGAVYVHNIAGSLQISAGPSKTVPLVQVAVSPTKTNAVIKTPTGIEIEVNYSGVRLNTPGGEVSIDNAGTVNLGPAGRGQVVTTLTHPFDFVTGLPILGSSSVAAGGAPSPVGLPSTFVSTEI